MRKGDSYGDEHVTGMFPGQSAYVYCRKKSRQVWWPKQKKIGGRNRITGSIDKLNFPALYTIREASSN